MVRNFVELLYVPFGFLGLVLRQQPVAELLQDADLAVRFHQGFAAPVDLTEQPRPLLLEFPGLGLQHDRVTVRIEQLVHVDRSRSRGHEGAFSHGVLLRGQEVALLAEDFLDPVGLRQLFSPALPLCLAEAKEGLESEAESSHSGYPRVDPGAAASWPAGGSMAGALGAMAKRAASFPSSPRARSTEERS